MSKAVSITEQIKAAQSLVLRRISDNGIRIELGDKTLFTCLRSNVFDEAIKCLVFSGVKSADVARVDLRHVAAQAEFHYGETPAYFNAGLYSLDNVLLGGHETAKIKDDLAGALKKTLALG